ncbi:MAG: hypothetical protein KBT27_10225 [Prevotellaceae bacterium]|nr:hypothetical protein [Candidatus Faecinaster equi]
MSVSDYPGRIVRLSKVSRGFIVVLSTVPFY